MKTFCARIGALTLVIVTASLAFGHVGSPNVYFEGDAGPYHLLITVNPPAMVPGVAQVQARVTSGSVDIINIAPVYVNGKDQGLPPSADAMLRSAGDLRSFMGQVWLMESGAWEIRAEVRGPQGIGKVSVPVPAYARRILPLPRDLGMLLFGLMVFLSLGVISIAGAAAREGQLGPAAIPNALNRNLGRIAMATAGVLVVAVLAMGNWWWNAQAADLKQTMLYTAPPLKVFFDGKGQLTLRIEEDFWHKTRTDQWSMSLIPDHEHLMHLFLVHAPGIDRFYHLHPERVSDSSFTVRLPALPSGNYKIFADIVRATGFPETMVSEIVLPEITGQVLSGDDSTASTSAFEPSAQSTKVSILPDGDHMVWEQDQAALKAGQVSKFRFRVEDADCDYAKDLEPYMGMAGHAEFVKSDLSVFAHIHPGGSIPMASLSATQPGPGMAMDHGSMHMLPAEVSFPYAFPMPGDYRMFVQVKRHGQVETGVFDAHVAE